MYLDPSLPSEYLPLAWTGYLAVVFVRITLRGWNGMGTHVAG